MTRNDQALDHYYSLNPSAFPALERITMYPADEPPEGATSRLTVEVFLYGNNPGTLHLIFYGVEDLKCNLTRYYQLGMLGITNIRSRQLEALNYSVISEDGSELSFYCKTFDVMVEETMNEME